MINDGSTDETEGYLKSLGNRIICFSQSNQGPGAARNLGAWNAKGEYLAFLDSDDLWFPWTLSCFAELIDRYHYPAVLAAKFSEFTDDSALDDIGEDPVRADVYEDYLSSHRKGYSVGAGTSALRHDQFIKAGGYTEQQINAEDHDLVLRMGTARGFVQLISPVTLGWRRHKASQTAILHRTFKGVLYLLEQETRGLYPGGSSRAWDRRNIITVHSRPVTVSCLKQGLRSEAWEMYRATFAWNAALGRGKYLAGFLALAAMARFHASPMPTLLSNFDK